LFNKRNTSLHFRNEIDSLKKIDLNWEKEKILRYLRATSMPGFDAPYTLLNHNIIRLVKE
jgi:methionyl-tRNA formyltransferase